MKIQHHSPSTGYVVCYMSTEPIYSARWADGQGRNMDIRGVLPSTAAAIYASTVSRSHPGIVNVYQLLDGAWMLVGEFPDDGDGDSE